ncbi:MAG: ABC transporter permease [Chloroflexi bacterium]|nr:ABC transporter permease [Chloroflexota bacterium]
MIRILSMIRKEFIQVLRDRRMLVLLLIIPIAQLIIFGYAINLDIKNIRLGLLDSDRSYYSRDLLRDFLNSGYFVLVSRVEKPGGLSRLLDGGKISVGINIPADFTRDLLGFPPAKIQFLLDGCDNNTAQISLAYATKITQAFNENLTGQRLNLKGKSGSLAYPITIEPRIWYNPDLKSAVFMIPGMLCLLLLMVTMISSSLSLVRERESGTIEQLLVSPLRVYEILLGKLLPFVIIVYVELILAVTVGCCWFGVPIRGNLVVFFFLSGIFLMTSLGLGLFISTISRSQEQAMMTAFFFMLPNMWLSGFVFPIDSMPPFFQAVTYLIPLRYIISIVRGIFLKGVGITVLWPDALALLIMGLLVFGLSVLRFRRQVA